MKRTFTVKADQPLGSFKPLHGVNNGPLVNGGFYDLSEDFRIMGPASIRLHDSPLGDPGTVDIHHIFPDFSADTEDPESYQFERTDMHLSVIVKLGIDIVYRLGPSIEHSYNKYHVHPPSDPAKWARVCANIVRHYNQKWADGFEYNIRYWEIWNEPDIRPQCWTGTTEQYLDLYGYAAPAIKAVDPSLMVGGPAAAHAAGELDLLRKFLVFCRDGKTPLDFVSWHRYGRHPKDLMESISTGLDIMKECGFGDTESHLNEWNLGPSYANRGTPEERRKTREAFNSETHGPLGAAFTASMLAFFQDSGLHAAFYYTAMGGGLARFSFFDRFHVPTKPYYSFKAFRALTDCGTRVATDGNAIDSGVGITAARDPGTGEVVVLLSNFEEKELQFDLAIEGLDSGTRLECVEYVIDGDRDLEVDREHVVESSGLPMQVALPAPSVRLLRFVPLG